MIARQEIWVTPVPYPTCPGNVIPTKEQWDEARDLAWQYTEKSVWDTLMEFLTGRQKDGFDLKQPHHAETLLTLLKSKDQGGLGKGSLKRTFDDPEAYFFHYSIDNPFLDYLVKMLPQGRCGFVPGERGFGFPGGYYFWHLEDFKDSHIPHFPYALIVRGEDHKIMRREFRTLAEAEAAVVEMKEQVPFRMWELPILGYEGI